ncbi:MAG: hypothetical protein ACRDTV_12485 [Mycobacterium sp.]
MTFSAAELRQMLYCCAEELRARTQGKPPGPQPWLRNLVRRLEGEVAVASSRQESDGQQPHSEHEVWIGSRQAARMLGCGLRTIQRRANDLDSQLVAGKLVFRESVVREYAEGLTDERFAS